MNQVVIARKATHAMTFEGIWQIFRYPQSQDEMIRRSKSSPAKCLEGLMVRYQNKPGDFSWVEEQVNRGTNGLTRLEV